MSDEVNILLAGMLDESKSVSNINNQIKTIQEKLKKVNISLNLDDFKKSFESVFGNVERQVDKVNNKKIEFQSLDKTINHIKTLSSGLENIFNDLQKIGNVKKISNVFEEDGSIKSFTVQLENAYGKLKEVSNFNVVSNLNSETGDIEYGLSKISNKLSEVNTKTKDIGKTAVTSSGKFVDVFSKQEIQLDKLNNKLSDYVIKFAGTPQFDSAEVTGLKDKLGGLSNLNPSLDEYKTKLASLKYEIESLGKTTKSQVDTENKMATALTAKSITIDKLNTKLSTLSNSKYVDKNQLQNVQSMVAKLNNLEAGTVGFKNAAKEATYEVSKLAKQDKSISGLATTFRTLSNLLMIGTPIMVAGQAMRDLISTVNELNHSMTEIRVVSGMSYNAVLQLRDGYNELGKSIGATTKEVMDSAVEFVRQGRSISETTELLNASIVGAKLSGIETAEMTEYLTSAVNGYNVAAEKATSVIDKLIAVDNSSATSMAELSLAMSRTSKSAQMVGVDIDHLIGYIGTVSSVTRKSAETIGEGFKTIFSRYNNVKLGKFVDDGIVASDVRKALGGIGIEIMETEEEFRGFSDVIDELALKWYKLSDAEKSASATALAGVRQKENFLVLMEEIAMANELTANSVDSNGLAMDRYNIYLESTEGKLNQLKASIEGVYNKTLSSDFVNFWIESGTAIANFTENIGGLTPVLLGLGSAFAVHKNVGGAKCCLLKIS